MSDRVLDALVAWGERTPEVRAMVLTSSRARPDGPVDEFSDYDVILVTTDPERLATDLSWQEEAYGPRMVGWGDEDELFGLPTRFRGVVYRDHVKVDYTIWPDALLGVVAAHATLPEGLDHGYRVLLDKDDRTLSWPEPTFNAYILARPSEAEYRAQVEEFWWDVSYLPKSIRRGDLFFASSFMLEHDLKFISLRRMLEWRIAVQRAWTFAPGSHGRHLEAHLEAEILHDLSDTYASLDAEAIWDAVFRLAVLYRRVAMEVAAALGYEYPQDIDDRMTTYLAAVRAASGRIGGESSR